MNFEKRIDISKCRLTLIDNRSKLEGMSSLWKKYGKDNSIMVNGPFFSMTTKKPLVHMKINGKVIYKPNYTVWGIGWNNGQPPVWTVLPDDKYDNYFTNTVLKVNGQDTQLIVHSDSDGTKEKPRYTTRPIIGFSKDQFCLHMRDKISLWGCQKFATDHGILSGIMGDGGASAAYITNSSSKKPSRSIPYWVLIEMTEDEPIQDPPKEEESKKEENKMIEVNAYSVKRDGKKKLAPNFKVSEFKCKDGSDTVFIAPKLVEVLQKIHDYYGTPVNILSGYRTDTYNKKIGGAAYSQHKYGTAADIAVAGVSPQKAYETAQKIIGDTGGLGIYSWGIHVDVREVMARWNG